jgi:dihydroneopterin aldolase
MQLTDSVVFIDKLRLYAFHGVMPQERRVGGWFVVSLRVHYNNMENVLDSDDVSDTLNYAELCELIRQEMARPSCLLEHVAGRIARTVFSRFPRVLSLHISVTKENPPMGANCAGAGVEFTFNK